ncbi:MAG TPA: hypothetical protein VLT88_07905 [Desulfosarcina sp.]|nr:hypothetical protein [Desulfosarcina sp.]
MKRLDPTLGYPCAPPHPLWPAPCRGARRLLAAVVVVTGLALLAAAGHAVFSVPDRHLAGGVWMNALTLSAPAMWTAGSPMRHPEMVHPGVDLRFTIAPESLT